MLLIDGNNLLHAARLIKSRATRADFDRARDELLHRLAGYVAAKGGLKILVVFDGGDPAFPGPPFQRTTVHGLPVLYASRPSDADAEILERIDREKDPKSVRVVTDDRALRDAAATRGARPATAREFLAEMQAYADGREAETPGGSPKEQGISEREAEEWMKEFGL